MNNLKICVLDTKDVPKNWLSKIHIYLSHLIYKFILDKESEVL